jgi:hypothetical protein
MIYQLYELMYIVSHAAPAPGGFSVGQKLLLRWRGFIARDFQLNRRELPARWQAKDEVRYPGLDAKTIEYRRLNRSAIAAVRNVKPDQPTE